MSSHFCVGDIKSILRRKAHHRPHDSLPKQTLKYGYPYEDVSLAVVLNEGTNRKLGLVPQRSTNIEMGCAPVRAEPQD